jgi:hypothetical protein
MRPPWKVLVILGVVWILAILVILWSRSATPTPASFEKYLATHDLNQASASDRARIIERAAAQLNRLSFEDRQQIGKDGKDREFFEKMTPDERNHFLDLTLPEGFHQVIVALNKMDPAKRRQIVAQAVENMQNSQPPEDRRVDNAQAQQIVSKGLETFYKDSSPEVKLDFAPVIEQIQKSTENFR